MQVIEEVEEQRRRNGEAVHPVQDAAVAGDEAAAVLHPQITLEGRNADIADRTCQADQEAGGGGLPTGEGCRQRGQQSGR